MKILGSNSDFLYMYLNTDINTDALYKIGVKNLINLIIN